MGRLVALMAVAVCAVSAAMFIGIVPPAGAVGANDYVALGDSYASGVGSRTYYADSGVVLPVTGVVPGDRRRGGRSGARLPGLLGRERRRRAVGSDCRR